ncbi:hypothetical protein MNBD_GAMMA01-1875 [hydrothermal vent metagenome]|uniref:Zinc finger CHCC-type domain-containing protein n=1 Tax=hydrothermal vent metagenome TaxID=652676 RepID=A0A3B0VIA8_9ZZZZ
MNQIVNSKPYHVQISDLPLSCPTKDMNAWSSHPKVYLKMDKSGEAQCQYCSTRFILDYPKS